MTTATAFTRMFGCSLPIQQAAFGGAATPALALAVSRAGGLGMLSGIVGADALRRQLDDVPEGAAVGVNFLVPFLDPAVLEAAAARSPLCEMFWGDPDPRLVDLVHAAGSRAGWQVGSVGEARAAADAGCDLVVVQGVEAGGHVRGTTPLIQLLAAVRDVLDLPIVAGGGIGTAAAVSTALGAGADAVRIGTRLLAAEESAAHPDYVAALIAAGADDTVLTTAFGTGWPDAPHRVLRSAVSAGEALGPAQSWTPDWPTADFTGEVSARALYAGTSVGAVHRRQPAARIIAELMASA
ncbi:MAG TPA: nitronate monooxygenase [Acidimicrobiales bacterium]|nr:nitronate monooxygenase [Acidimicrobiales bacterium]